MVHIHRFDVSMPRICFVVELTSSRWGLKACMLFFYNRLTFGLTQQTVVKALAVVSFITYIGMFLTISLSCSPFYLNWQVRPMPPDKCTLRSQNFIVCTTLNVLTDAALLCEYGAVQYPDIL